MALPNRLWLPDGGQDLPVFPVERVSAEVGPQLGSRWRKRAVLAGVEGQAERTVLVEWFSVADLVSSQLAPLRSVCHSNLLRLHQFGLPCIARPQQRVMARGRGDGQRRAPGTRAEHADLHWPPYAAGAAWVS